jgi:hypothetical protein
VTSVRCTALCLTPSSLAPPMIAGSACLPLAWQPTGNVRSLTRMVSVELCPRSRSTLGRARTCQNPYTGYSLVTCSPHGNACAKEELPYAVLGGRAQCFTLQPSLEATPGWSKPGRSAQLFLLFELVQLYTWS